MAKNEEKAVAIRVDQFAALQVGSDFAEVVRANIGDAKVAPFDLDRVRVPAGGGLQWEVPTLEGAEQVSQIEGVIVHWRKLRSYWRESFASTGGGTPPDCASEDGLTGIGDPGGSCAACPLAKFGSAENGRAQACSEMRMLFVIREGDRLPIVVTIPPSSLGSVSKYFLRLVSHGVPYFGALTQIKLARTKNKDGIAYSQVELALSSVLDDDQRAKVRNYAEGLRPLFAAAQADYDDVAEV
jgi:hypothetical protein